MERQRQLTQQQPQKRGRSGFATILLSCLSLVAITFAEIVGHLIGGTLGSVSLGALAGVVCLILMGGAQTLVPTRESWLLSWKTTWWFIAMAVLFMCADFYLIIGEYGPVFAEGWPIYLAETALLCVAIGINEEVMVRGIVLNGLLAPLGGSKRGVWVAIAVSSLYFGFLHVDFYTVDPTDALQLTQSVLKMAQTGIYGFSLACLTVRTEDVFSLSVLHGLDDFLLFVPSVLFLGGDFAIEYVSTDTGSAFLTMGVYIVIISLYIPVAVKAFKLVRDMPNPTYGAFHRGSDGTHACEMAPETL